MVDANELLNQKKQERDDESGASKWTPDAGDTLTGFLMKSGWYDGGEYDPSMFLLIKDEEGEVHRAYCPFVLHQQVIDEAPAIGSGIAIRYEGKLPKQSNPKQSYHSYTFVLIPDSEGKVKRDRAYWAEHGEYRRKARTERAAGPQDDGGFF